MGKIKKILENELVGGTQSTDVYPVTSTKAVYDTNNKVLDDYIQHLKKTSTFAGIATPTTNPGTPDGPVFYIAGEGTYANFSNIVIEAGQLGILKWNGTWSKEVLKIGAGGGSGGGGGVVDTAAITKIVNDTIKNVSWWGQKINNNKVDGNIVITKGSHSFTIELDNDGNLKFNGNIYATGGITALGVGTTTGGGSGVSLGTLLAQLNNENPFPTANGQVLTYNGSNFVWKTPTGSGGSSSSSRYPLTIYNGSSNTDYITYDGSSSAYLKFKSGFSISKVGLGYEISVSGGGSGSSGTTNYSLTFYKDGSAESWNGEKNFRIIFGNGLNVDWDTNHTYLTLSAVGGSGGSGGSTSTSVSWTDVTGKPDTFTPSSHTHTTSEITGLSNYVQGVKVNNASAADRLANAVTLWGNNFSGNNSIGTSSTPADLRYVNNIYAGSAFDIKAGNNSLLKVDGTPNIYVGFDYKNNANASILLFGNKTAIYTSGDDYHYDFKGNVFDVNSNQIHFGSETNGGKISWDAANNAFKIEGNVYATGGITALGVSNNATTSNNVDFTFKSVTSPTYKFNNGSYLTETSTDILKLYHAGSNQYILLNNQYENISNDPFLGNVIDSACMSFMKADWYYFDNSLVTREIYTNAISFCDTDGNQGATLSDIAISKVSNQTKLIFTIGGIQYYVNAN